MIRSYDSSCAVLSYRRLSARPSLINRSDYRLNVNEFPRDRRREWIVVVDHRSKRSGAGNVLLFVRSMPPRLRRRMSGRRCKKSRSKQQMMRVTAMRALAISLAELTRSGFLRVETAARNDFPSCYHEDGLDSVVSPEARTVSLQLEFLVDVREFRKYRPSSFSSNCYKLNSPSYRPPFKQPILFFFLFLFPSFSKLLSSEDRMKFSIDQKKKKKIIYTRME